MSGSHPRTTAPSRSPLHLMCLTHRALRRARSSRARTVDSANRHLGGSFSRGRWRLTFRFHPHFNPVAIDDSEVDVAAYEGRVLAATDDEPHEVTDGVHAPLAVRATGGLGILSRIHRQRPSER